MGQKVLAGLTMSLDGYITDRPDRNVAGAGQGGGLLRYWVFDGLWTYQEAPAGSATGLDTDSLNKTFSAVGAWLVGRTMHDMVHGWGNDPRFGIPVFVVTHRPHATVAKGDTTFEFVTTGAADALARARSAAGRKNVLIMGGANLLRQYLHASVVDELTITIAPVLLGEGKRLFDSPLRPGLTLEQAGAVQSAFATHLRYRLS